MLSFPSSPRSGQSYAAPNGQIYVYDGVKWIGTSVGSGGGTTYITNENPFTFSVAADDSTQREVSSGEVIKFIGAGSVTTASDAEGNITITGSGGGGGSGSTLVNGAKTLSLASTGEITLPLTASDAALFTVGTNKEFQISFGTDGILTLNKDGVVFGSDFGIDAGNNVWTFDTYGGLTFPDGNTITTAGNTFRIQAGTGNLLKLGDPVNRWTFNHDDGILTLPGETAKISAQAGTLTLFADVASNNGVSVTSGYTDVINTGTVRIISDTDGNEYIWAFGNGSITFPDNTVQTTAWTGVAANIESENGIDIRVNLSDSTQRIWRFGEDGDLTLPRGYIKPDETTGFLRIEGPLTANMVGDGGGYATISNGVEILTHRAFDDLERKFRFAWDGALYMPTDSSNSQVGAIEWRNVGTATVQIKTVQGNGTLPDGLHIYTYGTNSGTTIQSGFTQKKWIFRDDGHLTIPGDIKSEGNINIDINLADSTLRRWSFGEDGELTLPGGTDTIKSNTNGLDLSVLGMDEETVLTVNLSRSGALNVPQAVNFNFLGTYTGLINAQPNELVIAGVPNTSIRIAPNDGANGTFLFGNNGALTFPDNTVQTTAWTGISDIRGSVFADDSTLLVDGTGAKIVGEIDSPKIRTTAESIALGNRAGYTNQSAFNVAIGWYAGNYNQQGSSVAIGVSAGQTTQDQQSVAIGYYAGATTQSSYSVAIGTGSGGTNQSSSAVAIGSSAGAMSQGNASIAIGGAAGRDNQGGLSIAIGNAAAYENQGIYAISIGAEAGRISQGWNAVSIGSSAGRTSQGADAVAIGNGTGYTGQGEKSVAVGYNAANPNQGSHSVAIGPYAGAGSAQAANSIAINASSLGGFSPSTTGFFVNPLRNVNGGKFLNYNTSTYEIGYSNDLVSENDINIRVNSADSTQNVWTFGEDGSFTVANGISSFENFEIKINADDSTLQTFKFDSAGGITLPNSAQIRPSSSTYDAALATWESARQTFEAQATNSGITAQGWPFIAWQANGENAAEYLAELTRAWQIQQIPGSTLVFVPAISASLYNEIRSALSTVNSAYLSADNGVSISVQSSDWMTLGKSWNFGEDGNLTLPGSTTTIGGGANNFTLYTNSPTNTNGLEVSGNTETNLFNQSKVNIIANVNGVSNKVWKFDTDGSLTLPSEGKIINGSHEWTFGSQGLLSLGASSGGIYSNQDTGRITIGDSLSPSGTLAAPSTGIMIGGEDYVFEISQYAESFPPVWRFGKDRSLNIPGSITSSSEINVEINLTDSTMRRWTFGEDGDTVIPGDIKSDSGINIEINLADSTKRIWQFGEDGNLETPGDITASGNITGNILKIEDGVHEKSQALSSATGVVTHDCSLGHVFYHTSPSANWTANFTNLNLASGYATTVSLIIVQGGTGYYPNAVQIGGSAQTILWQGNTTPTVSTNRTDVASFSIINNSGTYVVLGQITGF